MQFCSVHAVRPFLRGWLGLVEVYLAVCGSGVEYVLLDGVRIRNIIDE
jgi:hypothetical protein